MTRQQASAIIAFAAQHALDVQGDPLGCGLTNYGLASCAAATALVLTDESHPNHAIVKARMDASWARNRESKAA